MVVIPGVYRESTPTDAPRTATVGRSVSMERSARLRPTGQLIIFYFFFLNFFY